MRTWDHHFVTEDFRVCGKMVKLKMQDQEQDNEINQNDIRYSILTSFKMEYVPSFT